MNFVVHDSFKNRLNCENCSTEKRVREYKKLFEQLLFEFDFPIFRTVFCKIKKHYCLQHEKRVSENGRFFKPEVEVIRGHERSFFLKSSEFKA